MCGSTEHAVCHTDIHLVRDFRATSADLRAEVGIEVCLDGDVMFSRYSPWRERSGCGYLVYTSRWQGAWRRKGRVCGYLTRFSVWRKGRVCGYFTRYGMKRKGRMCGYFTKYAARRKGRGCDYLTRNIMRSCSAAITDHMSTS